MDLPKKTYKDGIYTVGKVAMSAIPFVGGTVSEIFGAIISSPIEKRKIEWMEMVVAEIKTLKDKYSNSIEFLDDESFQSLLISTSTIALRTHQEEKRTKLKNALFNSIDLNERYEINQQYVSFIEELTLIHMVILKFIFDFQDRIIEVNSIQSIYNILTKGTIDETIPKINHIEITVFRYMLRDLESKGLIMLSDDLQDLESQVYESPLMSFSGEESEGLPYIKITQFGIDFLTFIEE